MAIWIQNFNIHFGPPCRVPRYLAPGHVSFGAAKPTQGAADNKVIALPFARFAAAPAGNWCEKG